MTIPYNIDNTFGMLFKWRGSLWRAVWKDLSIFLFLYYLIRFIYVYGLLGRDPSGAKNFEYTSQILNSYTSQIPLTFLLGFYITHIVNRWWSQFELVAWPDDHLGLICFALNPDVNPEFVKMRSQIGRYMCLSCALAWRGISLRAGLLTKKELEILKGSPNETTHWSLPIYWSQRLIQRGVNDKEIPPPIAGLAANQLQIFRNKFRKLFCYDWVCIPLAYSQVAAMATYGYFAICLLGRQFLDPNKNYKHNEVDLYVPIVTILQFLFYVGWFRVGQMLTRPFGTDDDDIELNYILDRHIQSTFAFCEYGLHYEPPVLEKNFPGEGTLPHTGLSRKLREHPPKLYAEHELNITKRSEKDLDMAATDNEGNGSKGSRKNRIVPLNLFSREAEGSTHQNSKPKYIQSF